MTAKAAKPEKRAPGIYVICGKDPFLVGEECEALLDRLLPVDQRPLALYQPPAEQAAIADVLDELRTLPFLAEKRVVLIKDADPFISAYRQQLENYFEKPSSCGVLVMTVSTWMKTTRLAKKLPDVGQLLDVADIKARELPQFAARCAETKHGKKLASATARLLVELAGDEPGRIASEVDKLAMYVGDRQAITAEDVHTLIGHNRMFNAFAVIDAVTAGDLTGALQRLRNMFASDKSAEYTVVGAFAYHLRKMFSAKVLLAGGASPRQAMQQLRIFGDTERFFRQLSRMTLEQIAGIICCLAQIDYQTKTGGGACSVAIEQLVVKLTVAGR
ncbi:MAG: DNA polymerase III subunit delta [Phycisphaerae bacterium]|nr:DNA polymerase III subunit delta [Phycisphaerae bacterium]